MGIFKKNITKEVIPFDRIVSIGFEGQHDHSFRRAIILDENGKEIHFRVQVTYTKEVKETSLVATFINNKADSLELLVPLNKLFA
jgi:hypothetical protein